MKDALGFEIKMNTLYGYSRRENGYAIVIIGIPIKINKETVTLKVKYRGGNYYKKEIISDYMDLVKNTTSVVANSIFPITKKPLWIPKKQTKFAIGDPRRETSDII